MSKFVIILPDGAADEPVAALGGRTPLEAARKPHIDSIARGGQVGLVRTVPDGFLPGSDVATLSLFGYDPCEVYPGRAPLEAAAQGLTLGGDQVVFRCNFVTLAEGRMIDFTAGHIIQDQADALVATLNEALEGQGCRFHTGVSYRNLMVLSDAAEVSPRCTPPHDIPDQLVSGHLPVGAGSERVRWIMEQARDALADHPINAVRRDLCENPATDVWLWGQGRAAKLTPFVEKQGLRGVVIAAVDLIRGIAISAGMTILNVPGATGYLDTDYAAKGRAACMAVDEYDLVIVHIEAPDEAGHLGDAAEKVKAIEQIDLRIVGPLLAKLGTFPAWRILVSPDHPTPVEKRVHTDALPPFCMCGSGIAVSLSEGFTERAAERNGVRVERGCELMDLLLRF
jgi:2,3-bisphosphoglycerate-independent phosphoglycerate mutase